MASYIKNTSLFLSIKVFSYMSPKFRWLAVRLDSFGCGQKDFGSFSQIQEEIVDNTNLHLCTKNHSHPILCSPALAGVGRTDGRDSHFLVVKWLSFNKFKSNKMFNCFCVHLHLLWPNGTNFFLILEAIVSSFFN